MADDRPPRKHNPAWPDPPEARAKRQAKRLAQLNEIAQSLGFETWRRLETAVIRGDAALMVVLGNEAIPIRFIDGQGYRCWPVTVTARATTGGQTDDPPPG